MKPTIYKRGVATLELLIALAVGVVMISGAAMLSFGGQTMRLDTELVEHGLYRGFSVIEDTMAALSADWNEDGTSPFTESVYTASTTIADISPCLKLVGGGIKWDSEKDRRFYSGLETLVSSVTEAKKLGGGCDPFPIVTNWEKPKAYEFPSGILHSGSRGTDVEVFKQNGKRIAFLTTEYSGGGGANLWIVDVTNPESPILLSSFAADDKNVEAIAALQPNYVFLASASTTAQLQIVDVSDPSDPHLAGTARLPNLTNGSGRSIFYYDNKIYIGTQFVGCPPPCASNLNNEFHIYDVSSPTIPAWQASINVDRNVNDIAFYNGRAYLAIGAGSTNPFTPLRVYDVDSSSGTYLNQLGSFGIGINRQGTAVYVLDDTVYLGLQRATSGNNFYIISTEDLSSAIGSADFTGNNTEVGDIFVQNDFAFVGIEGANSQNTFQAWDVSNKVSPIRLNTCTSGNPYPQNLSGLEYLDDLIFASFRSGDALRVIYDTKVSC